MATAMDDDDATMRVRFRSKPSRTNAIGRHIYEHDGFVFKDRYLDEDSTAWIERMALPCR